MTNVSNIIIGHRFERRFGHANRQYEDGQRSPIFFQFLDCVFQVMVQFPTAFEFTTKLLEEIAHHTVSLRFGTFLFDTEGQRREKNLKQTTVSLWSFINTNIHVYKNIYYKPVDDVIIPSSSASHIIFWDRFFLQGQQQYNEFFTRHEDCKAQAKQWKEKAESLEKEVARLKALLGENQ